MLIRACWQGIGSTSEAAVWLWNIWLGKIKGGDCVDCCQPSQVHEYAHCSFHSDFSQELDLVRGLAASEYCLTFESQARRFGSFSDDNVRSAAP